ncbi:SDR family oxidoreductase [Williamsia muralis]|uniref:Nucleoside-diphosphate sugar epimerase n=1 Tax=Williamsia marianensis TaxID=85044 RepID=A0A2G3PKV7_WILMA|nr:SDR family oxidoreductase [Williamsia marianensis]PHV66458.1 nucleoside-diphosphate sugar epimerase [Williamsia marianensis]
MQPATSSTPSALVTGATGYIGGRLAPRLIERGHDVRVLARTPDKLKGAPWIGSAKVIKGDLSDKASLENAFTDVDVVYHLVHSMGNSKDFSAEERRSAENVAEAARKAGVSRIVYLSGLHPSGVQLSEHLSSRTEVGEVLMESGIETIVLQAGVVIGSGSASFEMIRHLTERLPVMTTPKWVHNKIQPIAVQDVMHYLMEAATATVPESRTWDIGGPDVLEYGDMMQIYAEVAGLRKRKMIVIPFLTPSLASNWVGTVTPIPGGLARPLVESLEHDAVASEHDIDDVIAPPPGGLTPYRTSVELALARVGRGDVETPWSNASPACAPSEPIPSDPKWAGEEAYVDAHTSHTVADAAAVWKAIEGLGTENGWYGTAPAWKLRSRIDWAVGGPGSSGSPSHEGTPAPGDDLEWWRVETVEPEHTLRLRSQMRSPGTSWLEFRISASESGSELDLRTVFYPRGIVGRAYWYAHLPAHRAVYRTMMKNILREAERSV